jgi:16S rRNA (cytosine1402-N4)-methyltransferase
MHVSVLADEVLALLRPAPGELFVDGTIGGGGHARMILEATAPDGRLIGFDRDPEALARAAEILAPFRDRVVLRHAAFATMPEVFAEMGIAGIDGLLLDLGVSSYQLDAEHRGFSFRSDGPLDMRMDPTRGETAAEVLRGRDEKELTRIFRVYGEERWAGRIARRIVKIRDRGALTTTQELAELVRETVPGGKVPGRIHPATRVFQALRIYVNGELDQVTQGVAAGFEALRPGGRMAVISFHSLEDRIVKQYFQALLKPCTCPPGLPVCCCGLTPRAEALTRKGLRADAEEVDRNPRARSAVLRGIRKLAADDDKN